MPLFPEMRWESLFSLMVCSSKNDISALHQRNRGDFGDSSKPIGFFFYFTCLKERDLWPIGRMACKSKEDLRSPLTLVWI